MRYLSKIVKKNRVLLDNEPELIEVKQIESDELSTDDVGQIVKNNAAEIADLSLKKALSDASEIRRSGIVSAKIAFEEAVREGRELGFKDGGEKGALDGTEKARKSVQVATQDFLTEVFRLDMDYLKRLNAVKTDCVDFAFGLAENILGIRIDRDSEDYQKLIDRFFCQKPCKAEIEVDGNRYSFETLQAEVLNSCSDDLQGISVYTDSQNEQEESEETEQEMPKQPKQPQESAELPEADSAETFPEDDGEEITFDKEEEQEPEQYNETEIENGIEENGEEAGIDSEKYVFVRPARKAAPVVAKEDGSVIKETGIEFIASLGQSELKTVLRKAKIEDIAQALSGASEDTTEAIINALPRRSREKVLEVKKYLGPVPKEEVDKAAARLLNIAQEAAREGSEDNV